ncbi:MAG: helix-turn-helix domain-containing protein [Firmicutes bacterium]|nr:helix-turn-helix domain-containing protein [Bacillota bacterium]
MGRKSVKENKNIYQQSREEMNLTREAAAELLEFISADRIEKIEGEKTLARPEEVMKMSQIYKKPSLNNYYCSHECPIGRVYVPEIQLKDLSQITLELLATLNALDKEKNRFIEITVDGVVSDDERQDFEDIKARLNEMSKAIASLGLWVDSAMASQPK